MMLLSIYFFCFWLCLVEKKIVLAHGLLYKGKIINKRKIKNMSDLPPCPQCQSSYAYEAHGLYNCPECGHEWSTEVGADDAGAVVRDANGTVLTDGDSVTVIKDLKVKGSSSVVKVGTKVKNIRIVEGDHDIDCKIPGIGPMGLKSEFVKKISD